MSNSEIADLGSPVFRVDRIVVPVVSRPVFVDQVTTMQNFLRSQKGFVRNLILENQVDLNEVNFLSLTEWQGPELLDSAASAVAELHRQHDFDRDSFRARFGIRSEFATFRRLGTHGSESQPSATG